MKQKHSYIFIIFLLTIVGCSNNTVFETEVNIPDGRWNKNYNAEFTFNATDTVSFFDIYVLLKHGENYPNSNIWLFITTVSPRGDSISDKFEFLLADEKGKWYGKQFRDNIDVYVPYKTYIKFAATGEYMFNIQQGMRHENLNDVYEIGLQIEKHE